eukprot:293961-Chlamydomonas_euryale.AAC.5
MLAWLLGCLQEHPPHTKPALCVAPRQHFADGHAAAAALAQAKELASRAAAAVAAPMYVPGAGAALLPNGISPAMIAELANRICGGRAASAAAPARGAATPLRAIPTAVPATAVPATAGSQRTAMPDMPPNVMRGPSACKPLHMQQQQRVCSEAVHVASAKHTAASTSGTATAAYSSGPSSQTVMTAESEDESLLCFEQPDFSPPRHLPQPTVAAPRRPWVAPAPRSRPVPAAQKPAVQRPGTCRLPDNLRRATNGFTISVHRLPISSLKNVPRLRSEPAAPSLPPSRRPITPDDVAAMSTPTRQLLRAVTSCVARVPPLLCSDDAASQHLRHGPQPPCSATAVLQQLRHRPPPLCGAVAMSQQLRHGPLPPCGLLHTPRVDVVPRPAPPPLAALSRTRAHLGAALRARKLPPAAAAACTREMRLVTLALARARLAEAARRGGIPYRLPAKYLDNVVSAHVRRALAAARGGTCRPGTVGLPSSRCLAAWRRQRALAARAAVPVMHPMRGHRPPGHMAMAVMAAPCWPPRSASRFAPPAINV